MKISFQISKRIQVILLLTSITMVVHAQNPIDWQFNAKKVSDKTYLIHLTAVLSNGWHIYAQEQPKGAIAVPTQIRFNRNPLVIISGISKEIGIKEKYENKTISVSAYQYYNQVDFVQTIQLKANVKTNSSGTIRFQVCNEQMCLPLETIKFNLLLQ